MEGGETSNEVEGTIYFTCVQCGLQISTLHSENCKAVADEYIECGIMILVIDLILHKPKACKHLFYNRISKRTSDVQSLLWKSLLSFLILDIHRMWVLSYIQESHNSSVDVASLLMDFAKMLLVFGNLILLSVIFFGVRRFLNSPAGFYGWKEILLAVLVSSYFKIFLLSMVVWEFPSSVIYIIDMFVFSSNIIALKVITESAAIRCLIVGILARGLKFIVATQEFFLPS